MEYRGYLIYLAACTVWHLFILMCLRIFTFPFFPFFSLLFIGYIGR